MNTRFLKVCFFQILNVYRYATEQKAALDSVAAEKEAAAAERDAAVKEKEAAAQQMSMVGLYKLNPVDL